MLAILLKKMKSQKNNKEVGNLNLKGLPNNLLITRIDLHLLNTKHGNIGDCPNKLFLRLKPGPRLLHRNPFIFDGLLLSADSELFQIWGQVHCRVGYYVLFVLC